RGLLEGVRDAQDRRFIQRLADDLHTDWQTVDHARWDTDARQAGQTRRDRKQVVQVHRQWILGLRAQREGSVGTRRTDNGVELLEDRVEVLFDERAYFLRLEVVRIV